MRLVQYADPVAFAPVGYLAMTDPDGDSPIAPGLTNYMVAMMVGSATHMLVPLHTVVSLRCG